jgi:predicted permease
MSLFRDLRFGARTLRKQPMLTAIAIFALTLGIGLTTTMFSIVYGAIIIGLPFPDGGRIAVITRTNAARGIRQQGVPIQDYTDYVARQKSFATLGAYTSGTMNVSGNETAERFDGSWVTASALTITGVRPIKGRTFLPGEDAPGGANVALISASMWKNRYGGDTSIVGQQIRVNGVPQEIVGVLPDGFFYPNNDRIWLPLQADPLASKRGQGQFVSVVGMLKPGVTPAQAEVDIGTIAKQLAVEFKDSNEGFDAHVVSFAEGAIGPEPHQLLYTMLGAVFFVLLIACSNVANLLLDRAAHRTKEVGIRAALGAGRATIVRGFLAEAFLLAAGGTVFGIALAYGGVELFNRSIIDAQVPFFIDIRLHPTVLLFTIGIAIVTTLFAGLFPALQASRTDINEVLKDESRGASSFRIGRLSKGLVMFEIALSCGLLVAAGLMIKSVTKIKTMDTGFETKSVFTTRVGFPVQYTDTMAQRQFFLQLDERISALPGVTAAAISSGLPGARQGLGGRTFALDGKTYANDTDYPNTRGVSVTPGFFATLNIPLRQGRLFSISDTRTSLPVAVVNQRFIERFLSGGDPIGQRIRYGGANSTAPWITIVGVVTDIFGGDQNDPKPPVVFRPFSQEHSNFAYISARTGGPPMNLTTPVRETVASLNPDIPIYWPMTLDAAVAAPLWFFRVFGTMFMIFGFVALFLASIGLYAVMSFSVSRRTREVGIRMALGAQARDVIRLIFRQGVIQLGVGLVLGLALALGVAQLMKVVLFDVQPRDPYVFVGVAAVLALTGVLACLIPARRATHVDPLNALRED